jgi:hypothetical protein
VYAREVSAIIAYMLEHLQSIAELAFDSRFMPRKYQDVNTLITLLKHLASPTPVLDSKRFELPNDEPSKRLLHTLSSPTSHPGLPTHPSSNAIGELTELAELTELTEPLGLPDLSNFKSPHNEHQAGYQDDQDNQDDGYQDDGGAVLVNQPDYLEDYFPNDNRSDGSDGYVQEAEQEDSDNAVRPHNNVARRSLPDLVETDETGKLLWYLSFFKIPRGSTQLAKELGNLIACINIWWAKKAKKASSRGFAMFIHRVDGNPVYVAIKAESTERDFPRIELAKFLRDFYDIDLKWVNDDEHSLYGRSVVPYANKKNKDNFSEDTIKKILAKALAKHSSLGCKRSSMGCMIFPTESELVVGAPSQKVCDDIVECIDEFMARRGLPPKRKSAPKQNNRNQTKLSRSRN